MGQRVRARRNANRGFVPTGYVATVGAWELVKRAQRPRKTKAWTAFAGPSRMTKTPTMNAGAVHAMDPASANNTTACLARTKPSVCPGIAWTGFVAETSARACVRHVRRRAKDTAMTACVSPLVPAKIRTMNVVLGNAMGRALAINRKRRKPMEPLVFPADNALPEVASMVIAATPHARKPAKLAVPRKKAAEPMAPAATLPLKQIPMLNAVMADVAAAMERVAITTESHVPPARSVFRTIVSMEFVAATSARARVMRVAPRKRDKDPMALAVRSPITKIRTMNARRASVMDLERAINRKCRKAMALHVRWRRNARRDFVSTAFAAIRPAPAHARRVRRRKKAVA